MEGYRVCAGMLKNRCWRLKSLHWKPGDDVQDIFLNPSKRTLQSIYEHLGKV
ncbi:hypothetical protein H920_11973 [Fukomys damarensis]|uniref:Uncharacterized protein n=1 Tax=Fukomys damarensis TaxID=885580 RepID=A0A091D3A5_FUKDA|nr:hypothetical protein H920_11973 [Fukomys damarensis]